MKKGREIEIEMEARRRIDLWLKNSCFDKMTASGSRMRFDMSLGLHGGYPFELEDWMADSDFKGFVSNDEFYSLKYDNIISRLFSENLRIK